MTQEGFENYLYSIYNNKSGTAKSYITAIQIIDKLFSDNDVFGLRGKSLTSIDDTQLLIEIVDYICVQQSIYKKDTKRSFFEPVASTQTSYPKKGFCSAAIRQLLEYHKNEIYKEADKTISGIKKGSAISKALDKHFNLDKKGTDFQITTTERIGQDYFRKMVLDNYENKCCVTGLNIPQILRASHIVAWADDKSHRMDPENGLCLSATYDAAFDKHLISFDDNYRMIVGKNIKDYYTNDVVKEYFEKFEGKQITLPKFFSPNKELLSKHRKSLVI